MGNAFAIITRPRT